MCAALLWRPASCRWIELAQPGLVGPLQRNYPDQFREGLASKIGFPSGFQRATARSMNDLTPIEIGEIAAFTAVALLLVVTFVLLLKAH